MEESSRGERPLAPLFRLTRRQCDYSDRLDRIRVSLEKINRLLVELRGRSLHLKIVLGVPMPLYAWECSECGAKCLTVRAVEARDEGPVEELGERIIHQAEDCPGVMRRVFAAPAVQKGPGWGGGKGHWILWLLVLLG